MSLIIFISVVAQTSLGPSRTLDLVYIGHPTWVKNEEKTSLVLLNMHDICMGWEPGVGVK